MQQKITIQEYLRDTNKICNYRNKIECPPKVKDCRKEYVIYEAKLKAKYQSKTYIGLSSNEIKKRVEKKMCV